MNWTLEDFYAGDKVAVEYDGNLEGLRIITKMPLFKGDNKYYWYDWSGDIYFDNITSLPSAPLSYFISLLDAQESQQKKEVEQEYIYEPFSEEAAKGGAVVVMADTKNQIVWFVADSNNSAIKAGNGLKLVSNDALRIRRTIETKEVECYVYANGYISSKRILDINAIPIKTFTHTIKIPKK